MKTLFLILVLACCAHAQSAETATVFVYMPHHATTTWRLSGKFYVDEKKTAEISKNRYFVLHLPPGTHSFYVRDKKFGGLDLDMKAGDAIWRVAIVFAFVASLLCQSCRTHLSRRTIV
ncbi:MAG: DUF2846 domain-containing protein [Pyrinomonadaceae bacterium]